MREHDDVHRRQALPLGGRFSGRSVRLIVSRPVTDRGSVFVARLIWPVRSASEAAAAVHAVKRDDPGVKEAHHAMSAW